jgi:hypothetical protein
MQMRKLILLSVVVMLLGLSADTFAQGRHDRWRIRRGVRSGQLTRDEARELRSERRALRQERRDYRSDGTLSRSERREIRRDRRAYDRQIWRQRHDDDNWNYDNQGGDHRRGNGYYRRGAGSPTHPVFGDDGFRRGNGRGRGRG